MVDYNFLRSFSYKLTECKKRSIDNRSIAKRWFKISRRDLRISRLLFKNNFIPESLYHLQQFYEKLSKCYLLLSGRVTPEKVDRHDFALDKIKKEIKSGFIDSTLKLIKSINKETEIKIDSLKTRSELIENIQKNPDNIRSINHENIEKIFNLINRVDSAILNEDFISDVRNKLMVKRIRNRFKDIISKLQNCRVYDQEIIDLIEGYKIRDLIEDISLSIKINLLTLITFPHYNTTRYPYDHKSIYSFYSYNKLEIVNEIVTLQKLGEKISRSINKNYFKKVDKVI